MNIILKIAWRNVWRNPRRSWVLMTSIAVGVVGYLGTSAFSRGFLNQMVDSAINLRGGHIMISAAGFHENPNIHSYIRHPDEIDAILSKIPNIDAAPSVTVNGMISSSEAAVGVVINGVDPDRERRITVIASSLIAGSYLSDDNLEQIVIGKDLADRLRVRTGERVILMTSDLNRDISSAAYRIVGLYQTTSPDFDKAFVFIHRRSAQNLVGYEQHISSFAVKLKDPLALDRVTSAIKTQLDDTAFDVLTWKERNKLLELSMEFYDVSIVIMLVILFTVIAFSIANSFLMVIYERIYEFGVMMANGVLPRNIRTMLYIESFFITLIGLVVGFGLSLLYLSYWSNAGLDLSSFGAGLKKFGVSPIIYPVVTSFDVWLGVVAINVIVFFAILYPANKAGKFEVVDALRFD